MDKGKATNKCLKATFILFTCFIVLDLSSLHLRPKYEEQSSLYSGRRNLTERKQKSNNKTRNSIDIRWNSNAWRRDSKNVAECVGYGKFTTNKKPSCRKRLPNCLIIGDAKAGTYALLTFLSAHPQVVRNEKINEYDFFSLHYENGISWYKDKMPVSLPGQIILEKSPSYFPHPEAPERVYRMNPDIRLILIVRHPVHRSVSAYAMNKEKVEKRRTSKHSTIVSNNDSQTLGSFETRWKHYIRFYDVYFENWLYYFKLSQIHVVDGDKLVRNPINEMKKIETFLHIDPYFDSNVFIYNATKGFYCLRPRDKNTGRESEMDCMHEGKGRQHPDVSEKVIKEMQKLYRPHNQRFYELSGMHFDWDI